MNSKSRILGLDGRNPFALNRKDPLIGTGPEAARQLFEQFQHLCTGRPTEHAINAAFNILVNAIRQSYPLRSMAEARFDELFGKMKTALLSNYDGTTGKRREVFAFDQVVAPQLVVDKDQIKTPGGNK